MSFFLVGNISHYETTQSGKRFDSLSEVPLFCSIKIEYHRFKSVKIA
jgi:hypothetical protein